MRNCRSVVLAGLSLLGIFPGNASAASPERSAPPPGLPVAPADRTTLEKGLAELGDEIAAARANLKEKGDPRLTRLLPDVEVYVVINSGFTFCDLAGASNAQQTPKLPDFAAIDISVPRATRGREGVQHAGFFGEHWEWRSE